MIDKGLRVILIPQRPSPGDMEGTEPRIHWGSQGHAMWLGKLAHCYCCWILGAAAE